MLVLQVKKLVKIKNLKSLQSLAGFIRRNSNRWAHHEIQIKESQSTHQELQIKRILLDSSVDIKRHCKAHRKQRANIASLIRRDE